MISFLSLVYLNLSAPILIFSLYNLKNPKKITLKKILFILSIISIIIGNVLIYMLLQKIPS